MLKGKNLLILALVAGGAYWYWNKMKKDKAAKTTTSGSVNMVGGKKTVFDTDGMPNVNMVGGKKTVFDTDGMPNVNWTGSYFKAQM